MSFLEEFWDIQFLRTSGQTVPAFSAVGGKGSPKPVAFPFQHIVAVSPIVGHIITDQQVMESEDLGNIDILWAGETLVTKGALIAHILEGGIHLSLYFREFFRRGFFILQYGQVLLKVFRLVYAHTKGCDLQMAEAETAVELDGGQGVAEFLYFLRRVPEHAPFLVGRNYENPDIFFSRPLNHRKISLEKIIIMKVDETE